MNMFLFCHIFTGHLIHCSFNERTIGLLFDPPTIRTIFRIVLLPITNSLHSAQYSTALIG